MAVPLSAHVEEARLALRAGDPAAARRALAGAADEDADVLECRARAAYLELDVPGAIDAWERSYRGHRDRGDGIGAVRVARTLGYLHGAILGDWAVGSGWIARAQTLLADAGAGAGDSPERGWVALDLGMFEGDRDRRGQRFREALAVARATGDTDLEFVSLAYLGANLVHADRTEEGMLILDEALAAVAGREVDDAIAVEEIFCQLFSACEHASDVARAEEWIRVGEAIAERRHLPAVSAFCHTHYGGVLTAAGRWTEADAALTQAIRLWGLGRRALRGGALVRLADLRVRQGRYEEAAPLLEGLETDLDAARPLAALHLAGGRPALAVDVLERALGQLEPTGVAAARLLTLLVDVHLSTGDTGAAARAASSLAACAERHGSDHLRAAAALAQGRVCLATGTGDAQACLRVALAGFDRARLPMELARVHLELAAALATERPEVAMAEAQAALAGFERLQAARDADAAAAVLRSLGAPGPARRRTDGILTAREAEVLALLGHGLSNPEIAERLYISRKTVEHHVSNLLAKLGLRSRAEAAAHAARGGWAG